MTYDSADGRGRRVVDHCASCGHCRDLMEGSSCLFFPRLYRLHDREAGGGKPISSDEIKHLLDLCNTCGICPCAPVHTWIREAKDSVIERDGLPLNTRLIENVQLTGKMGSLLPRLTNLLLGDNPFGRGLKRLLGIHPDRRMPRFPPESFDAWAQTRGLKRKPKTTGRKVAYFTGCTARYLFPDVAKATVEVLQRNGVAVYVPEQKCCGMPTMLEGDRPFTFDLARFNVAELTRLVADGFDIVCSCPTCGYFFKSVLRQGAEHSEEFRVLVRQMADQEQGDLNRVSERLTQEEAAFTGRVNRRSAVGRKPWMLFFSSWKALQDRGYFATLDGMDRLRVANHTYDLGEYLRDLHEEGQLNLSLGPVKARVAYFAPCHQRHQDIGQPWLDILGLVPGMQPTRVGDAFDCCGLAGIMGFKKDFHRTSLAIGNRVANKINTAAPERLTTDCLSCQIQFRQMLPLDVSHPVEILRDAYRAAATDTNIASTEVLQDN